MKKLLLPLLFTALCTTGYAQEQQNQNAQGMSMDDIKNMEVQGIPIIIYVKGQTDQMSKDLALTGNQTYNVTKVNTIIAMKRSKIEHMSDSRQIEDAKIALVKYSQVEYQKVLSPEQYAKWSKMNKG